MTRVMLAASLTGCLVTGAMAADIAAFSDGSSYSQIQSAQAKGKRKGHFDGKGKHKGFWKGKHRGWDDTKPGKKKGFEEHDEHPGHDHGKHKGHKH